MSPMLIRNELLLAAAVMMGPIHSQGLAANADAVTTATLLEEMADLESLARWPAPKYRTIQFSSYDRRSTSSEAPAWFSNADGFGREPVPAFRSACAR